MKTTILISLLLLTSCQMGTETRIWKDCNPAMIEDYENIRTLQNNGFQDSSKYNCKQVFELVDQGALECNFNEKTLSDECRPNTWYEGTNYIKLSSKDRNIRPFYYQRVDPCEGPLGEIQGCSASMYFTQLDTW